MNTSRVLLKTSWEEVFGNETYNIYNNQTLIKGQGYYVTDTRFSNMTNNAISIICDANNSYGCKFLIENSVFSEISCENYSPLTIYFLGDVVQKNIAAFNTTNKVTGESTGEYSGQFERIDCEYVNVKRNEINESCISGCGKYTDNNPGTQISLN
ncbi:hypothetical protein TVAG_426380 [Trichomonas vaginalis G3]|uniref:Uncharacterized protein n=1 Tax=Trichomonas vaginalis (strain ATCC PRA-98 / G3) TaxID=412133 RepID=A2DYQ5_TRIV3|nr:hypothetical protein TVAGG3_0850430 [Trichomonas vaginalis G3]EAY14445.1 hypothetical protein TVAG_426380 [Trichomonas vaginalis G3]KAI5499942.1 hypothetical protein TVAGG3_0850430 [Trichomonas vaginalis G3]|eukprot:XP_001326668.1 hypothetical protein [Trichomonas vaginalis G3]